jgi:plastocyanin
MTGDFMKAQLIKGLFFIAALSLAACGDDGDSSGTGGFNGNNNNNTNGVVDAATATAAAEVSMTGNISFSPKTVTINAGEVVKWTNTSGSTQHTVTADTSLTANDDAISLPEGAPAFHSGPINPGQSFAYRFTIPGTYNYTCLPHEDDGMNGTVIVRAADDTGDDDGTPDRGSGDN